MQSPIVKKLVTVLAGVVVGGMVVAVVESAGHAIFPPPAGADLGDPAVLASLMDSIPLGAKLAVVVAWLLGSLAGGFAAVKVARRLGAAGPMNLALATGGVLLLLGAMSLMTIPHPLWMAALGILLPLPAAWSGARLAGAG